MLGNLMLNIVLDNQTSLQYCVRIYLKAALSSWESLSLPIPSLIYSTNIHWVPMFYGLNNPEMIKEQINHFSRGSQSTGREKYVHRQWGIIRIMIETHSGLEMKGGPSLREPKKHPEGNYAWNWYWRMNRSQVKIFKMNISRKWYV